MEAIKPQHHTSRSLRSWRHPFFCRVHPMLSLALCCQSCDADDGYAETGPKNPKSRGRPKKPLRNQGGLFIASTTTPVVPAAQLSPATAAAAAAAAAAATAAAAASAADAEAQLQPQPQPQPRPQPQQQPQCHCALNRPQPPLSTGGYHALLRLLGCYIASLSFKVRKPCM